MLYNILKFGILHSFIFTLHVMNLAAQYGADTTNLQTMQITQSMIPPLANTFLSSSIEPLGNINLQPAISNGASTSVLASSFPNGFSTSQSSTSANTATIGANSANFDASSSSSSSVSSLPLNFDYMNMFSKSILSNPVLTKYLGVKLPGHEASTLFFNIAKNVLQDLGPAKSSAVATSVGQQITPYKAFSIPLYFHASGNTIEKFLISEGYPIVPSLAESFANIVGSSVALVNTNDIKSLYISTVNGIIKFMQSLGFNFVEIAEKLAFIFNNELAALQKLSIYQI